MVRRFLFGVLGCFKTNMVVVVGLCEGPKRPCSALLKWVTHTPTKRREK